MVNILEPVGNVVNLGQNTLSDFVSFLSQQNILSLAIATAIGLYINTFITDIMNVVGTPIIDKILGNEKNENKKYICDVFGAEIELGKLIEIVIKLVLTLIIIYFIFSKIPNLVYTVVSPGVTKAIPVVPASK